MKLIKLSLGVLLLGGLFLSSPPLRAAEAEKPKKFVALSAEQAGPDFAIQGEYEGAAGDSKLGAQVVALGNGTFNIVFLPGGLPGQGWDGKTRTEVKSLKDEGKHSLSGKGYSAVVDGKSITGTGPGNAAFALNKVMRKSPTLGQKPPEGAVVLFDGTDTSAWNGGKITDGKLGVGVNSKEKFGDFTLHIEFILPFQPEDRGQGRANSGVYPQNRYEVQVLDSFGLTGEDNECGGIYKTARPRVNMCYPPLAWQTYDLDFTAARFDADGKKTANATITLRHNGVVVHDKQEVKAPTGGGDMKESATGPFHLQNHGNPVFYRNIWVIKK
jgi:hypothetical protein